VDDREAIARLKQDDIAGLEALFRKYQLQATRAADFIVRDQALAQDIVQAASLRAYGRIDQFQDEKPFGPWFLRMVVNAAIQAARRQTRWVSIDNDSSTRDASYAGQLLSIDPQLEEALEMDETRQSIWEALSQLSPEQRAAVVMRYYLGLSLEEMAERSSIPTGTVKWRLHAALKRLRGILYRLSPTTSTATRAGQSPPGKLPAGNRQPAKDKGR
jgi:RNA polymerase sigma-70 factor (ECF subfamily)